METTSFEEIKALIIETPEGNKTFQFEGREVVLEKAIRQIPEISPDYVQHQISFGQIGMRESDPMAINAETGIGLVQLITAIYMPKREPHEPEEQILVYTYPGYRKVDSSTITPSTFEEPECKVNASTLRELIDGSGTTEGINDEGGIHVANKKIRDAIKEIRHQEWQKGEADGTK